MNTKQKNTIPECRRPRWPFHRRSTAWLPTFTLCLFGGLLTAYGQDPIITYPNYPLDRTVSVGTTVSFQLYASSTNEPMTYQCTKGRTCRVPQI